MFDDGVEVEDVVFGEGLSVLRVELVIAQCDLNADGLTEGTQEGTARHGSRFTEAFYIITER